MTHVGVHLDSGSEQYNLKSGSPPHWMVKEGGREEKKGGEGGPEDQTWPGVILEQVHSSIVTEKTKGQFPYKEVH